MKKFIVKISLAIALGLPLVASVAQASLTDSCYSISNTQQWQPPVSGRQLTVVIDQTVKLPDDLQHSVWDKVSAFIKPGDEVKLYAFSASVPGRYMQLIADNTLDSPPSAKVKGDIPMDDLENLESCLSQQQSRFTATWGTALVKVMQGSRSDIPKSEIMHSLKSIGEDLKSSPAKNRIIFLVSDMLENSDTASFYRNNQIRKLDVSKTLDNVKKQGLYIDLGGANVYVLGAGLMTSSNSHYISGKTLDSLQDFWRQWFAMSNANLVAFGAPALNQPL